MTVVHALAIAALFPVAGTIPRPEPVQALTDFLARVADYVEIRREVTAGVDGPVFCSDPEELSRQAAQRAAAIREARPLAGEGTIFTPRAAVFFRERIAHGVRIGAIDLAIEAASQTRSFWRCTRRFPGAPENPHRHHSSVCCRRSRTSSNTDSSAGISCCWTSRSTLSWTCCGRQCPH